MTLRLMIPAVALVALTVVVSVSLVPNRSGVVQVERASLTADSYAVGVDDGDVTVGEGYPVDVDRPAPGARTMAFALFRASLVHSLEFCVDQLADVTVNEWCGSPFSQGVTSETSIRVAIPSSHGGDAYRACVRSRAKDGSVERSGCSDGFKFSAARPRAPVVTAVGGGLSDDHYVSVSLRTDVGVGAYETCVVESDQDASACSVDRGATWNHRDDFEDLDGETSFLAPGEMTARGRFRTCVRAVGDNHLVGPATCSAPFVVDLEEPRPPDRIVDGSGPVDRDDLPQGDVTVSFDTPQDRGGGTIAEVFVCWYPKHDDDKCESSRAVNAQRDVTPTTRIIQKRDLLRFEPGVV